MAGSGTYTGATRSLLTKEMQTAERIGGDNSAGGGLDRMVCDCQSFESITDVSPVVELRNEGKVVAIHSGSRMDTVQGSGRREVCGVSASACSPHYHVLG